MKLSGIVAIGGSPPSEYLIEDSTHLIDTVMKAEKPFD